MTDEPRFCRETQAQLPFLVSGELTGLAVHDLRPGDGAAVGTTSGEAPPPSMMTGAMKR